MERLGREGLLDDVGAAKSVVRSKSGRYGRARIQRELSARGFSAETIAAAFSEADASGEERSLQRTFTKLWASSVGLPRERRRRRVWSALMRRGFAANRVSAMMKDVGDDNEIDGSP
jgi:regulatory protein